MPSVVFSNKFPASCDDNRYCYDNASTPVQQDACLSICSDLIKCGEYDTPPNVCTISLGNYTNLGPDGNEDKAIRFAAMQSLVDECSVDLFENGNGVTISCDTNESYQKALETQSFQYIIDPYSYV